MDLDPSAELAPSVDFALLADAVQAAAGKLYVLGGGWDTLFVRGFPAAVPTMGLGLRLRVPWDRTGERFELTIDLQDEDGRSLLGRPLPHRFSLGRPPGHPDGADVGAVRAFTFNNVPFPKAGGYAFIVSVEDREATRVRFTVRTRPQRTEGP